MPYVPIKGVGSKGIVRDISPVLLPPDTWSDGLNVRFDNGSVSKILGHSSMFTLTFEPELILYWPRPTGPVYVAAGGQNVIIIDPAGNMSDITGSTTFTAGGRWQGSLFDGGRTIILNNGVDIPQYMSAGADATNPAQQSLQPLPGWPSDTRAAVVRPVGQVLMAGDLTVTVGAIADNRPGQLMISSESGRLAGVPSYGNVPNSWTFEQGVTRSQDTVAVSTGDPITEIVDFRGNAVVFTGNSIHSVQYATTIQAPTVVRTLNEGNGIIGINGAVQYDGQILVVDRNDIYVTGGSGDIRSVVDHKLRDYFFTRLNDAQSQGVFLQRNQAQDEIWICYPSDDTTDTRCDEALVWNYRQDTWGRRQMPLSRSATQGPSTTGTAFLRSNEHIVFTGQPGTLTGTSSRLHLGDNTTQFDGVDFDYFVEKTQWDMDSLNATKWTGSFYPLMSGDGEARITFHVENTPGATVDLTATSRDTLGFDFNVTSGINGEYKIDPRLNGRFVSFRIAGSGSSNWKLDGYTIDVDTVYER